MTIMIVKINLCEHGNMARNGGMHTDMCMLHFKCSTVHYNKAERKSLVSLHVSST